MHMKSLMRSSDKMFSVDKPQTFLFSYTLVSKLLAGYYFSKSFRSSFCLRILEDHMVALWDRKCSNSSQTSQRSLQTDTFLIMSLYFTSLYSFSPHSNPGNVITFILQKKKANRKKDGSLELQHQKQQILKLKTGNPILEFVSLPSLES